MEPEVNILIQTCIAMICVVTYVPVSMHVSKLIPHKVRRLFHMLLVVLCVDAAAAYADFLLSRVPDSRYELIRMLITAFDYVVRPLMMYIVLLIMTRESTLRHKNVLLAIPTLISLVVALMSFFTDKVFYYDEANNFVTGPLRYVFFAMLAIYFFAMMVVNIYNYKKDVLEAYVVFGIIILLVVDFVVTFFLHYPYIHEQVVALLALMYISFFLSRFHTIRMEEKEVEISDKEQQLTRKMLDQSIETLAYTIDAKDIYARGHSLRVAKYARAIAKLADMDEERCREVYIAGLLHDIGKISIKDDIINKNGKLTEEEYAVIKKHPEKGAMIMTKMIEYPFLLEGVLGHHERYDGKGYPKGLKGEEIPEIARIIAVADAYDAMTSYRSYRKTMSQAEVKQEIWSGMDTQFDPYFAKLMISLIDSDIHFEMRENLEIRDEILFEDDDSKIVWQAEVPVEITADNQIMMETNVTLFGKFIWLVNNWADPTDSVTVYENGSEISFTSTTDEDANYLWYVPTAVVFSADDGKVGGENYDELGIFISAGYSWRAGSALSETLTRHKKDSFESWEQWNELNKKGMQYCFSAIRKDCVVEIILENELMKVEAKLILPENFNREIYFAVTGERCSITNVKLG